MLKLINSEIVTCYKLKGRLFITCPVTLDHSMKNLSTNISREMPLSIMYSLQTPFS